MIKVNVHDAKTHLSRYLDSVEAGEVLILCRHNRPIAELRPIRNSRAPRRFGLDKGKFELPDSFFEPLPEDLLQSFNGEDED